MDETTVEFQTLRMRTPEVKGKNPCPWKGNSFITLEPHNVIVQRFRPAVAEAACLR
jgi:hypothetical protein